MKKRISALIISNNFITSITLNNMLRKLKFEQIIECGLSENAIKIINENTETEEDEISGAKVQWKQLLGLGVSIDF